MEVTQPLLTRIESAREPTGELFEEAMAALYGHGSIAIGPLYERFFKLLSVEAWEQAALLLLPDHWVIEHWGDNAMGPRGKLTMFGSRCHLTTDIHNAIGDAPTRWGSLLAAILRASEVGR